MPMPTMTQINLVQTTFAVVAPLAEDVAALFYRRLFEIDPSLESMFPGDMSGQRRKLMVMLTAAVKGLPRLDRLIPVLEDLGRRHAEYGVIESHYETVGEALLWTLEKGLGPEFTPDVKEAWTTVYGVLAATMKAGVEERLAEAV
jgi:hemoglobin-like flavoprotein